MGSREKRRLLNADPSAGQFPLVGRPRPSCATKSEDEPRRPRDRSPPPTESGAAFSGGDRPRVGGKHWAASDGNETVRRPCGVGAQPAGDTRSLAPVTSACEFVASFFSGRCVSSR
jgi:hypothetical protein